MLIRSLREEEKQLYNRVVNHPLQSWEWGDFRTKTGLKVERVGFFDKGKLTRAYQVTFHHLPVLNRQVGYLPKGFMPDEEQLASLQQVAKNYGALFIKLEPQIMEKVGTPSAHFQIAKFLQDHGARPGRPLFTKYTFVIDLHHSQDQLFSALTAKTRYNVNLAYKRGVRIYQDSSQTGLENYLKLLAETTHRQQFYAHSPDYFRVMWPILTQSGLMKIFHAIYQDQVISSWIMFEFNRVLYYPYGASSREHREVMANNLLMWEMIRYGQAQGCTKFDLWGALGPEPDPQHPWFGFHRFKAGYGGDLYESVGTYDLINDPRLYPIFRLAENWRWKFLRLKAKLGL